MKQAIGFFGWKRPEIALRTLKALARCPGIENWPLVAFLDNGYAPEVATALAQWKASPLVGIHFSLTKLGCSGNMTRGIQALFNLCEERFIVLEDDCYPAEDFIEYMENELGVSYVDDVLSISAYRPEGKRIKLNDDAYTPGFHCWGWGTWKSRMGHFWNALLPVRGDAHNDSWDVRLNQYAADHGMGCIIPRLCHIINIGTQDATHTKGEDLRQDEYAGKEDVKTLRY